jgi:hypothetical protein
VGALGAIVLADTRRLDDCFASVDVFERRQIPFVLAVNCFHGIQPYTTDHVCDAIDLDSFVPIIMGDVRQRESSNKSWSPCSNTSSPSKPRPNKAANNGRSTHAITPEPAHSELVPACVMTTTPESSGSHRFSARLDRQNMVEDLVGIPSALRFLEFLVVPAVVQLGPWDA